MILHAYGKINLGLDVVRRLPNGYHEVKMIMQSVDLHDTLRMEKSKEAGIRLSSDAEGLLCDDSNLIVKAAGLLMKEKEIQEGIEIFLEKRIPMAAGMAGGSADAAAALVGVNQLFDMGFTTEQLQERGVSLGADIPFCITGGTQLSEGIGEQLTILPEFTCPYILIAKPDVDVSTKYVYENLHADSLKHHPDIDGMVDAIKEHSLIKVTDKMENVLETVTEKEIDIISSIKKRMKECGAIEAMMSGSGPTVFGIFSQESALEKAFEALQKETRVKILQKTRTVPRGVDCVSQQ